MNSIAVVCVGCTSHQLNVCLGIALAKGKTINNQQNYNNYYNAK
jgi:hypothetical protein